MTIRQMTNTEIYCLKYLAKLSHSFVSAREIVWDKFPKTKQPGKKCVTITCILNRLSRSGFAREIGSGFQITDAGIEAAKLASQHERPIVLGLA